MLVSTKKQLNSYPKILNWSSKRYKSLPSIPGKTSIPLLPKRIIPINKLDVTIDKKNRVHLNSPITLKQAWNCYYALCQSYKNISCTKLPRVTKKWLEMTNLMREDFRKQYEKLLLSGQDIADKQYRDLKLVLAQNKSVLSGVSWREKEGDDPIIILDDEVNLDHAQKYFNELNENNNVQWEDLPDSERFEYRNAYRELLSAGRDMYQGKIVPLTTSPQENNNYVKPKPEPKVRVTSFPLRRSELRTFYVKLRTPFFVPFGFVEAKNRGQSEYTKLSKEELLYYELIYFDLKARTRASTLEALSASEPPSEHIKQNSAIKRDPDGSIRISGEITLKDALVYFEYMKLRKLRKVQLHVPRKDYLAVLEEWKKMTLEEKEKYRLQYKDMIKYGYIVHDKQLVSLSSKVKPRYEPQKDREILKHRQGFRYYTLKRASDLGDSERNVRPQTRKEWNSFTPDEKEVWFNELDKHVYQGKEESQSKEMIRFIYTIRRSIMKSKFESGTCPIPDQVRVYYFKKRLREWDNLGMMRRSVYNIVNRDWKNLPMDEYNQLESECAESMSQSQLSEKDLRIDEVKSDNQEDNSINQ
ncbi:uncharacterized protein J8A68_005660 [[Candida] subhashii]|uniref:Uncharacterized protein n=1 Tax=[Candida] subhashii TaxID=561895 RepID=A0A8J5UE54_9ASCO|nr:uncharacterized protein J8A68_005660 [[Candida] subhashii]KAG7660843.1 hypothetical protein J8A68_005660 [[Candida] subhashii]